MSDSDLEISGFSLPASFVLVEQRGHSLRPNHNNMIQKHFIRGSVIRWNKRPTITTSIKDGSIVDQPVLTDTLLYKGADDQVTIGSSWSAGLRYRNVPGPQKLGTSFSCHWLNYMPGRTTQMRLTKDTLTGFMSGCPIATWRDPLTQKKYVGHIGTISQSPLENRVIKDAFLNYMPTDVKGYIPSAMWSEAERSEALMRKIKTDKKGMKLGMN